MKVKVTAARPQLLAKEVTKNKPAITEKKYVEGTRMIFVFTATNGVRCYESTHALAYFWTALTPWALNS